MGFSSKTQKTTNTPVYAPQIEGAASTLSGVYNQNAPKVQGYADQIGGLMPNLLAKYQAGDAGVNAARGYITSTLGGEMGSNPQLQNMIDMTGNDVASGVNAHMGTRGLTGGSVHESILAKELAKSSTGLRYADYNNNMDRRAQAAGMAPGVAAADTIQINPILQAAQTASGLPMDLASQFAAGTGGLLGQYQKGVSKSDPSTADKIGKGLQIASFLFSDMRLKTDISRVGATDGGLPVYTYRYGGAGPYHMGVMAQDVASIQPGALGPVVGGFATVNYQGVA